VFNFDQIDQLA